MDIFHGTVVDIAGRGVLLRGPSGAGKSDLALRLIDRGATLVADDQVILSLRSSGLIASAPDKLYGLLEVRGLGLLSFPAIRETRLALVADLVPAEKIERLPHAQTVTIAAYSLPQVNLNSFEISSVQKIELALEDPRRIGSTAGK